MPVWRNRLSETASALRQGQLPLHGHIDNACARMDQAEAGIASLLPEKSRSGRLRAEAGAIARAWPEPQDRPEFFGVLLGVKDCIRADGHETRAGSNLPPFLFAGPEATIVSRFRQKGALVLGKTVTTEFTLGHPGPTRNPHDLDHTPGGSSSGSAAAVAAGFCSLALGTQTGGSVIRPAAYCGVVGYKPTYGRIPADGTVHYAPSLDHVGLFTQDIAGMTAAARLACDGWRNADHQAAQTGRPVLGIIDGPYMEPVSVGAMSSFQNSVDCLRTDGNEIKRITLLEDFDEVLSQRRELALGELANVHRDWFGTYEDLYSPYTAERIRMGQQIAPGRLNDLRRSLEEYRQKLDAELAASGIDVLISPSALGPAPQGMGTGSSRMNQIWTYTGHPVVTLPSGTDGEIGLPLGLQLIGRCDQDEHLLAWAQGMAEALCGQG